MSITIPTGDLTGILADVIPFAFPDDNNLPEICCVRLEWDGETLHAMATDRYRLGWSQWTPGDMDETDPPQQDDLFTRWGGADEPWAISIDLDDAKELVKVFKLPTKEMACPITVDHDAKYGRAKVVRTRDTGHSAITIVAEGNGLGYPDLRVLLAANDRVKAVRSIQYNPGYLADFGKVRPRGPLELTFTGKLTQVTIGKRFQGAIARLDGKEENVLRDGAGLRLGDQPDQD